MNRITALTFLTLLCTVAESQAQFGGDYVRIKDIRVGFKPSRFTSERDEVGAAAPVVKNGFWAPVSFKLEVLRGTDKKLWVELESLDDEKNTTTVRWPLGAVVRNLQSLNDDDRYRTKGSFIEAEEMESVPMVRVGGKVTMRIVAESDGSFDRVSSTESVDYSYGRDPSKYVILSLGSKLGSFDVSKPPKNSWESPTPGLNRGRIETCGYDSIEQLPDHWYGYTAADLVIIATGNTNDTFLKQLFDDNESQRFRHKREALLDWVRRGGRLVISLGRKTKDFQTSVTFKQFLPFEAGEEKKLDSASIKYNLVSGDLLELKNKIRYKLDKEGKRLKDEDGNELPPEPLEPVTIVPLKAKTGTAAYKISQFMNNAATLSEATPVLQVPYGLGRFTALAFDIDASPFVDIGNDKQNIDVRAKFWQWLVQNAGSKLSSEMPSSERNNNGPNYFTSTTSETDMEELAQVAIRRHIDDFEGVPVISFGWIALIIILYTLIVGPLEYLFLKKILGRLELTWVTFPIIVITISAAAAYATHAIKGKDLRINKVDVIDLDMVGGRTYGRSWFTILSPRVDTYTLGIEGKEPWSFPNPDDSATIAPPETLVDWQGGMKQFDRSSGSSGLSYRYAIDPNGGSSQAGPKANGVERVPIKVYSTKAFTASWSGYMSASKPPVGSTIAHTKVNGIDGVSGTITMNLPLSDVGDSFAIYAGNVYTFDKPLNGGTKVTLDTLDKSVKRTAPAEFVLDSRFFTGDTPMDDYTRTNRSSSQPPPVAGQGNQNPLNFWGPLFYEYFENDKRSTRRLQNASLRMLDQSWRVNAENKDEVILLVRLRRESGPTEESFASSDSASPSRLWVKGLPGSGPRQSVPGKLQQETYIRIFIPVKPGK